MKYVLWFAIALSVGVYLTTPIVDPDLWWHITVGRWILGHGELPTVEYWNLFALGTPWQAYSWSIEILLALLDKVGDRGLLLGKMAVAIGLTASLMYSLGKTARHYFFGGLWGVFAAMGAHNHLTLRPQSVVWIYFVWLIYQSERLRSSKEEPPLTAYLWLTLLMALWSNAQITQIIGMGAVFAFTYGRETQKRCLYACGAAFLGTLLTPNFGAEWITFFSKSGHPLAFSSIAEFSPATILMYSTSFLLLAFVYACALCHFQTEKVRPMPALYVLGMVGGSLAVLKFMPMAVIACSFFIVILWRDVHQAGGKFGNLSESIQKLEAVYTSIPKEGLTFVLLCIVYLNGIAVWRYPVSQQVTPVRELDFIEDKRLPRPLAHGFGKGGYVMYRQSDDNGNLEHKVVMDGRTNVNPPEVWQAFHSAFHGRHGWQDFLEITEPKTILWHSASPFSQLLLLHPEWCFVFRPGSAAHGYSVFLHNSVQGRDVVKYNCEGGVQLPSDSELFRLVEEE